MKKVSISEQQLRAIVRKALNEDVDYNGIKVVTSLASILYKAIQTFEQKASDSPGLIHALKPEVDGLKEKLEHILHNPGMYLMKTPSAQQGQQQKSLRFQIKVCHCSILLSVAKSNETKSDLFSRLTRLFRSGPVIRKKISGQDTPIMTYQPAQGSLFFKSSTPTYHALNSAAYAAAERSFRYQDFIEMESMPEISTALNIYADESCSQDEKGRTLHVYSDNTKIQDILENLFYDVLNVEFNLKPWIRNAAKYGDQYIVLDVHPEYGVTSAFPLPVNDVEREDHYDPKNPMAVRFKWMSAARTLENWEMCHIRLLGNDAFLPYGTSVLDGARKIWRQLVLLEDAMLVYRIVRAPERRVFYFDVGAMPEEAIPAYIEQAKSNFKSAPVIDSATGRIDQRYNPVSIEEDYMLPVRGSDTGTKIDTLAGGQNAAAVDDVKYMQSKLFSALGVPKAYLGFDDALCLTGDTLIPLLDGRTVSMKDLAAEHASGKQNWVYSCNADGSVKPGKILSAWKTKETTDLLGVVIDNGEVIKCTPNHPFMMKDGTYKRADELEAGDSLMPVYRRISSKAEGDRLDGYEMIWQSGEWVYTHKLVNEAQSHGVHKVSRMRVIHHSNFNKLDNAPENLTEMTWYDHRKLHSQNLDSTLFRPDVVAKREPIRLAALSGPGHRAKKSAQMKAQHADVSSKMSQWVKSDELKQIAHESMLSRWSDPAYYEFKSKQNKEIVNRTEVKAKLSGENHWVNKKYAQWTLENFVQYCHENSVTEKRHFDVGSGAPFGERYLKRLLKENGYSRWRDFAKDHILRNHKVFGVAKIVCDTPVEVFDLEIEEYHNFLTSAGVQVHNSSKSTLAQEDVRFSRSISSIQRTVIAELNKIAVIHLFAHGFVGEDLTNFILRLPNPSTVAEQQKLELYRSRFEIAAATPQDLFNQDFLRRQIFGMTDDEIAEIELGKYRDKRRSIELENYASKLSGGTPGGAGGDEEFGGAGGGGGGGGGGGFDAGLGGGGLGGGGGVPPGGEATGLDAAASGLEAGGGGTGSPGGAEGETPPAPGEEETPEEINADDDPNEDDKKELLTSGDELPIKRSGSVRSSKRESRAPSENSTQQKYHRRQRRKQRTGPVALAEPDFISSLSHKDQALSDPTDSKSLRSFAKMNVESITEGLDIGDANKKMTQKYTTVLPSLSPYLMGCLVGLKSESKSSGGMLNEEVEREIDVDIDDDV